VSFEIQKKVTASRQDVTDSLNIYYYLYAMDGLYGYL